MSEPMDSNTDGDTAEPFCRGCAQQDQCRRVWSGPKRDPLTPAGLSLASAVAFLLPLLTCILGGALAVHLFRESDNTFLFQALGAIFGLILGIALARLIMPFIRKRFHESAPRK